MMCCGSILVWKLRIGRLGWLYVCSRKRIVEYWSNCSSISLWSPPHSKEICHLHRGMWINCERQIHVRKFKSTWHLPVQFNINSVYICFFPIDGPSILFNKYFVYQMEATSSLNKYSRQHEIVTFVIRKYFLCQPL